MAHFCSPLATLPKVAKPFLYHPQITLPATLHKTARTFRLEQEGPGGLVKRRGKRDLRMIEEGLGDLGQGRERRAKVSHRCLLQISGCSLIAIATLNCRQSDHKQELYWNPTLSDNLPTKSANARVAACRTACR